MKRIRIILATVTFTILTIYFLDFASLLPQGFHGLTHIQLVPAILSGSIGIVIALLVLTLLLGRIYCSVVCPLGIMQDVIDWFARKLNRKKKYTFTKEKPILRYSILGATIVSYLLGFTAILTLLDPYSAYGRIATNILRPLYLLINNIASSILTAMGNYTLYTMDVYVMGWLVLTVSIITLLVVGIMSYRHGRSYCNTICPVGTLLGVLSRYSIFGIRIEDSKCNHCMLCQTKCKASCIDSKNQKIDYSRCVTCFDCIETCKHGALKYSIKKKGEVTVKATKTEVSASSAVESKGGVTRGQFLATLSLIALAKPKALAQEALASVTGKKAFKKQYAISPPGSGSHERFNRKCTACQLCVTKCPSEVLQPSSTEYGYAGIMQPRMSFEHGFCNFDCTTCSDICPNGALQSITKEQKHTLQVGKVNFILDNCIVNTDNTSCGACSEHCPTQAVEMVEYRDGLTIPQIDQEICVGCGGCEYVCPALPYKAIYIEGNPTHMQAKPFVRSKKEDIKIDDFGF